MLLCYSPPAIERLSSGLFQEVIITNTIPVMEKNYFPQLTVLSVANLLGETIWRVHDDCSVSSIFQWRSIRKTMVLTELFTWLWIYLHSLHFTPSRMCNLSLPIEWRRPACRRCWRIFMQLCLASRITCRWLGRNWCQNPSAQV